MAGTLWTSDFHFGSGRVKVRATGADLMIDRGLLVDMALWLGYYIPVRLKGFWASAVTPGPRVWFAPAPPRPWSNASSRQGWSVTTPCATVGANYYGPCLPPLP